MPYLIDGYNLLRFAQSSGRQLQELNEHNLCRLIAEFLRAVRDKGSIIFDGTGPPDKSVLSSYGGLKVVFSGKSVEADEKIEDKIAASTAPKRLFVVSSDNRLITAAKKRKACTLKADQFWHVLIEKLQTAEQVKMPEQKTGGLTQAETNCWMDIFGVK